MIETFDAAGEVRLDEYITQIGQVLGHKKRRASFALYVLGLMSDAERKSIEPIAAQSSGEPRHADAMHQQLHHFIATSEWDDVEVRRVAARHAISAMESAGEPVTAWILDDTGFLKQGSCSVGVQRQYTGSAGKITNCQIGVSLSVATAHAHVPIDFALYLPESWMSDPERRKAARIPEDMTFKTKADLALEMMERASREGIPGDVVLGDADYGKDPALRDMVRLMGLDYAFGVYTSTELWLLDRKGRRMGAPRTAGDIALAEGLRVARRMSWREGTSKPLRGRFAFLRVKTTHDDGRAAANREEVWLVAEYSEQEPGKPKCYLTTLPRRMSHKQIVRVIKERYRTERVYQELKTELGLDHFEGRSYRGWQHHVTAVLCCYAFVVAERVRRFPPSGKGSSDPDAIGVAA